MYRSRLIVNYVHGFQSHATVGRILLNIATIQLYNIAIRTVKHIST